MRIGVDLGGTKIEAIALSPAGQEITRLRVTTPRDYAASLDAIVASVLELERAAGRPVRVMNDANCFALSEATDGAAAGAQVVFGVILGTGVGGGIVVDGRCLPGANLIAGEWGHN